MAIFINDLFDFFWLYTVPGNVLNVVVVPLRLQLPESHRLRLAQGSAGFEAPTKSSGVGSAVATEDLVAPSCRLGQVQRIVRLALPLTNHM